MGGRKSEGEREEGREVREIKQVQQYNMKLWNLGNRYMDIHYTVLYFYICFVTHLKTKME